MELPSKSFISVPTGTPVTSGQGENITGRRLPSGTGLYHLSTDASLFSTSLPLLSRGELSFKGSDLSGQSFDDGFPNLSKLHIKDEVTDPLEGVEPCMIGSFLPGDENELLSGLTDDFDLNGLRTQLGDLDDDIFEIGGGLEIENESLENLNLANGLSLTSTSNPINGNSTSRYGFTNGMGTFSGEHPYGERPSRTLFVRNINSNVEDSELRSLFEQYGDIRTLYTACKHRGFVMISYYDIRAARTAMHGLQNMPLRRRKLDIHFSIPKNNPSEKDINQGTLVAFNLDPLISNDDVHQIFGAYGEVKEIRETPHKRHHKFIEFYDVRAAEAALKALNRSDIAGKQIKLEPSRPGGARRSLMLQLSQELEQGEARILQQVGSPMANSPPGMWIDGSWPNYGCPVEQNSLHGYSQMPNLGRLCPVGSSHMPGLASVLRSHVSSPVKIAPFVRDLARMSHVNPATNTANTTHEVAYHKHSSVPSSKLCSSPGHVSSSSDSKPSSIGTLSGPQFLWESPTIHWEYMNSSAWLSLKGGPFPSSRQGIGFPYTSQQAYFLGSRHHVGSAPPVTHQERNFGFFPESPDVNQATLGVTNFGHNNGCQAENICSPGAMNMGVSFAGNFPESGFPSSQMIPMLRNGPIYHGNSSFGGRGDGIIDHGRGGRADVGSQIDKQKQYLLDLEKIVNGEDIRTTLMIKNIPNRYTSKMLLAAIDETHKDTYDFLYLPIDFKNKCNVGYAFINMVTPSHIITFYEAFNGKKWEKFNSEKVASLAYARIQGKTALVSHFQNSCLMNEDKQCWPIVFQSEGQQTGDQEHFLSGNLNIFIRQPDRSYAGDSGQPKG